MFELMDRTGQSLSEIKAMSVTEISILIARMKREPRYTVTDLYNLMVKTNGK